MKILGYDYKIKYPTDQRTMGRPAQVFLDTHIIQLAYDQIPEEKISSILHEIIEILDHTLELRMPHQTITCLEAGLYQVLIDNGVDLKPLLEENPK